MKQPEITYEEFLKELRSVSQEDRVVSILDNHGENLLNELLGIVDQLTSENNYFESEKILQVLANAFDQPEFYSALALAQKKQNKYKEAKSNYKKSLALDPSLFKIYYNYGILLVEMKEYDEAVESFEHSLLLNPEFEQCYYNLGNCCRELEDFKKAEEAYEKALDLKPDYGDAAYNLAVVQELIGERDKALETYNRAIEIDEHNIQARWNKSLLLLQAGDYKNGFREYEWRMKKPEFIRDFPFPFWQGEDLKEKKILVYCEQGLGDAIQFSRFIKYLNAGSVSVECRRELIPIFESIENVNEVIQRNTLLYNKNYFDYAVSIMSLPFYLNLELHDIQGKEYLTADTKKSGQWKSIINNTDRFKIGIMWAGNPTHKNDKFRSMNPETLLKSVKNEKTDIYSLQLNCSDAAKTLLEEYGAIDLTNNIDDFSDTAGLVDNLDLIITVDTSIAHLTGSMGIETWVLLPFNSDWRWLLDREDTPWYSSVKLFRQKYKNDWSEVLSSVRTELKGKLNFETNSGADNSDKEIENKYFEIENHINDNELEAALKKIEYCLTNDPMPYRAFNFLGILFAKTKNYDKAEEYFSKTINIKPDFPDAVSNLGIIYFEQNKFEDSILLHKKATELNNPSPKSYFNLGYAYQESGDLINAKQSYKEAVKMSPDYADAQFNLALIKLLDGGYETTWNDYNKWAFISGNRTIRDVNKPEWKGENFTGKKLYVYPDQGLGDVLQLVRYLPMVKEKGGEVIFECQASLFELLKNIKGFDKIVKTSPDLSITEEYDLHIPLQNLPGIFNTSLETIPDYDFDLQPCPESLEKWKKKLTESKNLKIGFVWTGNQYPPINRKRHAGLNDFIPLFELEGIDYYSLQLGEEIELLKHYKDQYNIFDLTDSIVGFEDTAALISNLDLVITIDTSVAHLAGAMNKKTFTLLPFIPDWRWGLNSDSTPWYPSMKLFRQHERARWEKPVNDIKKELENFSKGI